MGEERLKEASLTCFMIVDALVEREARPTEFVDLVRVLDVVADLVFNHSC